MFRSVICLAGVARSGTSWIGQVLASHPSVRFRFQPLFSYEFKGRVSEDSTTNEFRVFFSELGRPQQGFLRQDDKVEVGDYPRTFENGSEPVLVFKENRYQSVFGPMLRRVPEFRLVGLVRNPCAVLNSWRANPKEFPAGADFSKEWRHATCKNRGPEDCFGFYRWKEVANSYLDLQSQLPDRVKVVRYEDVVRDPETQISKILNHCDLADAEEVKEFLRQSTLSHSSSYYSVFKHSSVADRWREELPTEIRDEIYADLSGTRLEIFLT